MSEHRPPPADTGAPLTHARIAELLARHRRLVVCTVTRAQGSVPRRVGARMAVLPDSTTRGTIGGGLFEARVVEQAVETLTSGESQVRRFDFRPEGASADAVGAICGGTVEVFLEVVAAPDHLLIVGGGHCGRALARAAALLETFRITLVDQRLAQSERDNLPESIEVLRADDTYAALPELVDCHTSIVLVSQGAVTDEAALRRVIESEAAYIGMMGSRKKVRTVFDNLRRDGVSEHSLKRVHAPIGLEIGSETPAEIAVSILAEIITLRRGAARPGLTQAPAEGAENPG